MNPHAACTLVLMIAPLLSAETSALQTYPTPCSAVEAAALPFFSARSLTLLPQPNCPGCFIGKTSDLHDATGKKVTTRQAMHLYMAPPPKRKSNPIVWHAHSSLDTVAYLTLHEENSACHASLVFHYGWYEAQFLVVMPVDGNTDFRPSNLRLEAVYLVTNSQSTSPRIDHTASPLAAIVQFSPLRNPRNEAA